jgi:hypothetical protein
LLPIAYIDRPSPRARERDPDDGDDDHEHDERPFGIHGLPSEPFTSS